MGCCFRGGRASGAGSHEPTLRLRRRRRWAAASGAGEHQVLEATAPCPGGLRCNMYRANSTGEDRPRECNLFGFNLPSELYITTTLYVYTHTRCV